MYVKTKDCNVARWKRFEMIFTGISDKLSRRYIVRLVVMKATLKYLCIVETCSNGAESRL